MLARNHTTQVRSLGQVLNSKPFLHGYSDFRRGVRPNYDTYTTPRDQTRYERGRQFASVDSFRGSQLLVCQTTVDNFVAALRRKDIV